MDEWILVKEKYPEKGEKVWYFFEIVGVHRGVFIGFEQGMDVFEGVGGVLSGDVTHWMPDAGQEKPDHPVEKGKSELIDALMEPLASTRTRR